MKNLKNLFFALLIIVSSTAFAQNKTINAATSNINWVGKKVTGQHSGTIKIKSGTLVFKKDKLKGGSIVVDMTTISTTDLKAGEGKEKLDGHLKAADFFGVEKHPTSKIDFKKIADKGNNVYTVTADLTIKNIKKSITFDITATTTSATAALKVDRTKYDIKYGSGSFFDGLGDKAINDEFELNVSLKY